MNPTARPSPSPAARRRTEFFWLIALTGLWTFGWLAREPGLLQGLDYRRYYFFNADWLRRALLAGEIPWWNPHVGLGRPFAGDLQTTVFYPPAWLHAVLGVPAATLVLVWLHQVWAAWGLGRLGLRLGLARPAAWFCAGLLVVSPVFAARFINGGVHYGMALCYLPGLFWLLLRLVDEPGGRRLAILALVSALQLLCGHPQVYWLTNLGLGLFALLWTAGDGWWAVVKAGFWFAGAMLLCLALTAPVLLPFFELIGESNRAGASPLLSTQGAMHARDWLGLILPPSESFIPDIESLVLVGAPVLWLAVAALGRWRTDRAVRALAGLAGVAAVLASSLPEILRQGLMTVLPGFAAFRLPARLDVLVVFALLLLAGSWVSAAPRPRWLLAVVAGLTLLSFAAGLPTMKRWYVLPADYPAEPVAAGLVRELQAGDPARVPPRLNFSARLVRENSGMVTGHSTFNGYVSLYLGRVWEYVHLAAGLPPPPTINTFPDVRIFERDPFLYHSMNFVGGFDTRTKEMRLAAAPDPRAYLCYAGEVTADWHDSIRRMVAGEDFHRVAMLESPVAGLGGDGHGIVKITRFAHESVRLQTESSAPAILVLAEAWYPGWRVTVNGQDTPAFPVNGWMRGVRVPSGTAEVVWHYHSRWFATGLVVGVVALGILLWLLVRTKPPEVLA